MGAPHRNHHLTRLGRRVVFGSRHTILCVLESDLHVHLTQGFANVLAYAVSLVCHSAGH